MRVRSEARRQAIIKTAGEMFLSDGYAAVSLVAVANQTGLTRVTLYGYFASKEALFGAFVTEAGRRHTEMLSNVAAVASGKREVRLQRLGRAYVQLVSDPAIIEVQRLIVSEARRFPEMAAIFYEVGPRAVLTHMMQALSREVERKELVSTGLRTMTLHFMALCDVTIKDRCIWGVDATPTPRKIQEAVKDAVSAFLAAYGRV